MVKNVKKHSRAEIQAQTFKGHASIGSEGIEHSSSRHALSQDAQGESFGTSAIKARAAANNDVLTKF
jgi:hypothetical protein